MNSKVVTSLAYVLHTRPYRETSLLVELLTEVAGKITVVARGAKRGKSKLSSVLQPFWLLRVSWYGDKDLVTLTAAEYHGQVSFLLGRGLVCGLYVNELLVRLLNRWDPCASIFVLYRIVLAGLSKLVVVEDLAEHKLWQTLLVYRGNKYYEQIVLRLFEKHLLQYLGYALPLEKDSVSGQTISVEQYYSYEPTLGPRLSYEGNPAAVCGASLLGLAREDFTDQSILLDLKRLMRKVLAYYLGDKALISRQIKI